MRISAELDELKIERPIDEVFAFLSNLENRPSYGMSAKTVKDTGGPVSVGTVYREETKAMRRTMSHQTEVTSLDPPTGLTYSTRFENGMTGQARFTLTPTEGETLMKGAVDMEMPKVPQLFAPFFSRQAKRHMTRRFQTFKELVEGSTS